MCRAQWLQRDIFLNPLFQCNLALEDLLFPLAQRKLPGEPVGTYSQICMEKGAMTGCQRA